MKKMKKFYEYFKKIFVVTLIVSVVLLTSLRTYASSSSDNVNEDNVYIKQIMALVNGFYPDIEPEIVNMTPIYFEGNICEIAMDISYDSINYGYVIFDNNSMNISQFVINKNTEGFCMECFGRDLESDEVVSKIDLLNYEIIDSEEINYVGSGENDNIFDIFIDDFPDPMYINYTMSFKSTGRICRIDETRIDEIGGDFCCGVVAALNVCGGYELFDKTSAAQTYNAYKKLWYYSDPIKQDKEYVMNQANMGNAVASYYKEIKGKEIPYKEKENPSVDFFIDAIDKKYSSILGVICSSSKGKTGHAVCVEGYYIFEPINEVVYGESQVFLSVATGWESEVKFIWYDKVNVDSTYGVVFMQSYK